MFFLGHSVVKQKLKSNCDTNQLHCPPPPLMKAAVVPCSQAILAYGTIWLEPVLSYSLQLALHV